MHVWTKLYIVDVVAVVPALQVMGATLSICFVAISHLPTHRVLLACTVMMMP
jgi:hypothetical protein